MTVIIAPDSFKGTFTASEVASAIASGVRAGGVDATEVPLADGGEGTLAALAGPMSLEPVTTTATGPWGETLDVGYGIAADGTVVIESARIIGLHVPSTGARDPLLASTRGVGELIADAVKRGATGVVLALGGSATSDGGMGAISAIDDLIGQLEVPITLLTDVTNGYLDAATVFAPQKGANERQVALIQERLISLAAGLPRDPRSVEGAGAAGGLAGGLWARYDASIESGARYVIERSGIAGRADIDVLVTGEGCLDGQSRHGKLVSGVLKAARGRPVHAVVGSIGTDVGVFLEEFSSVTTAPDLPEMHAAGLRIAEAVLNGS
ncbi:MULTISPECIES: glycerate kinase [unclassified Aeromicrobium]|uniref:glycerate kinase family protein n=1 Tax=unclassified Aeromicrobium TaxID=2633570 RepID=UPI00396AF107